MIAYLAFSTLNIRFQQFKELLLLLRLLLWPELNHW